MEIFKGENLAQSYGCRQVLSDISFGLDVGEKVALIGPNGAGKTTLMNVITGVLPTMSGRISLLNHDITNLPSYKRVFLGMARSFQLNSLFPKLNLLNNVLLAIQGAQTSRYQMWRPMSSYHKNLARAQELLELVDLWEERDSPVTALSYGQQRQVEIILALASNPKLLLLDEPSAGLSRSESGNLTDMIRNLTKNTTVFFSAHDLDLVFSLADRVMVLYNGKIMAQKPPEEIQADPKVREIYLGIERDTRNA